MGLRPAVRLRSTVTEAAADSGARRLGKAQRRDWRLGASKTMRNKPGSTTCDLNTKLLDRRRHEGGVLVELIGTNPCRRRTRL
jgi:hypothetical protein